MNDRSPLRLADSGSSSSNQSRLSQNNRNTHEPTVHLRQEISLQQTRRARSESQSSDSSKSGHLRNGAKNVIEIFIPVSICMAIVVGTIKATDSYHYSSQSAIWYAQMMFTDQSVDTGTRVWQSFVNAFIMLLCIVVMTTVLILLYKFRCYATIHGWLILGSLVLLFMFALMYIAEILKVYNLPMDVYSTYLFIWNFGVIGMICIHWKGPLLLQQAYLITISALMALTLIRCLPDWTIWTVLAIVSVWDLIAVLCPRGPLRILVETAQERNESIFPALIYSSTMAWEVVSSIPTVLNMAESGPSRSSKKKRNRDRQVRQGTQSEQQSSSATPQAQSTHFSTSQTSSALNRERHPVDIHYEEAAEAPQVVFVHPNESGDSEWPRDTPDKKDISTRDNNRANRREAPQEVERTSADVTVNFRPRDATIEHRVEPELEEERGVKLGLGDFIFFSVLVGKASSYGDWTITISCYVAILVGLCLTLSLLAIAKKALPALPISIAFGLSAFFLSYVFVVPFSQELAINQIFV